MRLAQATFSSVEHRAVWRQMKRKQQGNNKNAPGPNALKINSFKRYV